VKACTNENKKETTYCCNQISGTDMDCCDLSVHVQFWYFGNMDVHGTALIMKDGHVSSIPNTSDGKHEFCITIVILRLKVNR